MFNLKPPLIKWLEENHLICPCEFHEDTQVDTLFVDNNSLKNHIDIGYNPAENPDYIPSTIEQLDKLFYFCMPKETFFFSVDGALPASRYQKLRVKKLDEAVQSKLDKNFSIPNEETFNVLRQEQDPNLFDDAIKDFISNLQSQDNINTKRFIYSNGNIPGESSYKFFDYFGKWRLSQEYIPKLNHFVFSNNIETVLFSLKFLNEKISIIYPYYSGDTVQYSVINISNIRDFLLHQLAPKRQVDVKRFFNDIIALMLIADNGFIPQLQLFRGHKITYSELFNAYFKLNENMKNRYKFLIDNDVFSVSILQEISTIMSRNASKADEANKNRRKEETYNALAKKYGSVPPKPKPQNNLPSMNTEGSVKYTNKQQWQHQQQQFQYQYTYNPQHHYYYQYNQQNQYQNPKKQRSGYIPNITRREQGESFQITSNKESSQELLRVLNYAFIYYTQEIPSWNYYYPYKYPMTLCAAVKLMEQEYRNFFDSLDDDEFPDKLLEILIILPVYFCNVPWSIYKIKIDGNSSISSKYWPSVHSSSKVPLFNLQEIKDAYKNALSEMQDDEIMKFNIRDDVLFILEKQQS